MSHERIGVVTTRGGLMFPNLEYRTSRAVRAGRHIFLQGQTGLTLDGKRFVGEGDPAAQAEQAMSNVRSLLEEAGAKMDDICKVTTYVTDSAHRDLVYPVLARYLHEVAPVSTGLVVKALALPEMDFEIDVFAVIPDDREIMSIL